MNARQHLGELIELVHYQHQQFRVTRNRKSMARLVSESYMQAIEQLLGSDPALVETLEIMMDQNMIEAIEQGQRDVDENRLVPLKKIQESV